ATDMGADIINLSLGGEAAHPGPLADAVAYAEQAGVVIVAAAGNDGVDLDGRSFVPATLPHSNVVAVTATDRRNELAPRSNFGVQTVELAAPGVEIVTTTIDSLGRYRTRSGTSFAAPHVSAAFALMKSVNPDLGPVDLIDIAGRHGLRRDSLVGATTYGTRLQVDAATMAASLTDIAGVFEHDIVWMALEGLTKGCNPPRNDRYCPERAVTRGELAAFLHRALDLPAGPDAFVDDDHSVFEDHIDALAHAGLTKGCNPPRNDRYCPDLPVTRGELAAFLRRALDLSPPPDRVADHARRVLETALRPPLPPWPAGRPRSVRRRRPLGVRGRHRRPRPRRLDQGLQPAPKRPVLPRPACHPRGAGRVPAPRPALMPAAGGGHVTSPPCTSVFSPIDPRAEIPPRA